MSENAKALLYWKSQYENSKFADYDNSYEREAALNWAAYIIGIMA